MWVKLSMPLAVLSAIVVIADFWKKIWPARTARTNRVDTFHLMMRRVDCLRECFEPLRDSVRDGTSVLGTKGCQDSIEELVESGYERAALKYKQTELFRLLRKFVGTGIYLVAVFASLYLSTYALDIDARGRDTGAFQNSQLHNGTVVDKAIESLYWSSTTFVTLGYGDVSPDHTCKWARMLVILEVFTFFCLFLVGPGIVLVLVSDGFALTKEEFDTVLRDELAAAARSR